MSEARIALLAGRGVVSVTGSDAETFLDNLATNDLAGMAVGAARFAALLTPQGKILFEFIAVRTPAGYLLDTALDCTADLAKRIGLYKLRAKVEIKDAPGEVVVAVSQGDVRARPGGVIAVVDPRDARLGDRLLIPAPLVGEALGQVGARRMVADFYASTRVAFAVPEGGPDYRLGDTFPHEANYDLLNGVSFTKGCYIGQEVVARMHNKTVVRKRIARISGEQLVSGATVNIGDAVIGSVGTVAGGHALAMLRLDRVAEAMAKGQVITVGGAAITIDPARVKAYRDSVVNKPVIDL